MDLLTIGALARRGMVPVRTVRFWSDEGLIPVARRSRKGYRLYGAEAVVRLELVRTLRELGVGLDAIASILAQHTAPADIAEAHIQAIDGRIRALRAQRATLRVIARRNPSPEEMTIMNALARMSAAERQRLLDDFVARVFDGVPADSPGRRIGDAMRRLPPELPDDPTSEALAAWIELGELVSDPSFAARVREMAVAGAAGEEAGALPKVAPGLVLEHAGAARDRGVDPRSPGGQVVLERIVPPDLSKADRRRLAETMATFTDERVERYWSLIGVLHGGTPAPPQVPAFRWFIEALRADG